MDCRNNGSNTTIIMASIDFLQLKPEEKREVFSFIQKDIPLPLASIEKDWWVVQTLGIVFQMDSAPHMVFKGGTSLSKAWGIIERFSEDVDLALSREFLGFEGDISRTQVGKLRDASFKYISETFLPELKEMFAKEGFSGLEIELSDVKTPDQDPVNIVVRYPSDCEESPYILPEVKLEIGSRAMREPFENRDITSLVGEKFKGRPFADESISIPCVKPERTFLEKLFLLHEEFQRPKEKIRVERLSRHLYDIIRIAGTEYAKIAMEDKELFKAIVQHRERFTKLGGVDYTSHYPPNLNPVPPKDLLDKWKSDYNAMQKEMIYGESLDFDVLIAKIEQLTHSINSIKF